MAGDTEDIVLQLTGDTKQFERSIRSALGIVKGVTTDMVAAFERAGVSMDGAGDKASKLQKQIEALTGAGSKPSGGTNYDDLGKSLDNLRAKYSPLFAAQQSYLTKLNELNSAEAKVALTEQERSAAITQLKATFAAEVASINGATTANTNLAKSHTALSTQAMAAQHSLRSSIEMLAMGIPPSQVLTSQLNHLSYAATGPGGLKGAFKEVGASVLGVLTSVSPLTLGLVAVAGAAVLWGVKALGAVNDLDDRMKAHVALVKSLKEAYGDAAKGVDTSVKESQEVLKALLNVSTDKLQKDFEKLAKSAAAPGQQMAQFVDDFGRIIDTGADKFAPFRKAIDDFNNSVRAGKPDVATFRDAISETVNSSADQKVRSLGGELLDASKNAGDLANNLKAVGDAGKGLDVAALAAAAMNKSFADSMKTLGGTVSKNLDDREKIIKNYNDVMKTANSDDKQIAAMAERDNQLAILSYNDRKKAAKEAADAAESAVKRFQSAINSQSKSTARTLGASIDLTSGIGQLTKLETQYKLTEAAQQAFGKVTPEVAAQIDKVATAAGNASDQLARAKVAATTDFAVKTAFLTPADLQIAQQLKGIYGNDVPAALASSEAAALRTAQALQQIGQIGQDITRGVFTDFTQQIRNGASAMDALKTAGVNALGKIADKLVSMAADNLWSSAFGGSSGLGGIISGLIGGGGPTGTISVGSQTFPKFASGTDFAPGGLSLVGEKGPELVNLPRGSQVIPNDVLRSGGGAGTSVSVGGATINIQGDASASTIALIKQALAAHDAALPSKVVAAVTDARKRRQLT